MLGLGVRVQIVLSWESLAAKLAVEEEALDVDVDKVISQIALILKNFFAKVTTFRNISGRGIFAGFSCGCLRQVLDDDGQGIVGIDGSLFITLFLLFGLCDGGSRIVIEQSSVDKSHVIDKAVVVVEDLDAVFALEKTSFLSR